MIPQKSSQSGGDPCPFDKIMATMAAASITQDNGFHMKPRNWGTGHSVVYIVEAEGYVLEEMGFVACPRACSDRISHTVAPLLHELIRPRCIGVAEERLG